MDYANKTRLLSKRPALSDDTKTIIAVIVLFFVYSFVGTMEYNDALADQQERQVCRP